jgi:hypothetical protein
LRPRLLSLFSAFAITIANSFSIVPPAPRFARNAYQYPINNSSNKQFIQSFITLKASTTRADFKEVKGGTGLEAAAAAATGIGDTTAAGPGGGCTPAPAKPAFKRASKEASSSAF